MNFLTVAASSDVIVIHWWRHLVALHLPAEQSHQMGHVTEAIHNDAIDSCCPRLLPT